MSSAREQIIVALDVADLAGLTRLTDALKGSARFVKVGMELFYSQGHRMIERLQQQNFRIFLDLKIHDIPTTAQKSVQALAKIGVDIMNVHAAGGLAMMKAAREGLDQLNGKKPLLIAVTQLTSTTQEVMERELKVHGKLEEVVTHYALQAQKAALDGVVASPLEVPAIKKSCGENFITVTPGIRPKGVNENDQKRVTTPGQAIHQLKSDYIVIGRAITQASDPAESFEQIVKEIANERR